MCGIAGLFLKDAKLEPDLGFMLAGMLSPLNDRGPDSAGFAVYGAETPGHVKFTLRLPSTFDLERLLKGLRDELGGPVGHRLHGTHVVLSIPAESAALARRALTAFEEVAIVGAGRRMEIFKEVGRPDDVSRKFGLDTMSGTHAVGHTRMATESAVTTNGAHPFTTGDDQCLVHNGSLSNHCAVRRELIKKGLSFQTENDTEVAAGFITAKLKDGGSLRQAMEACLDSLDGFYTFVIGTDAGFGVWRDPIACKPAVVAETDRLVAFGTEYRALVDLPGIASAKVWEPAPATVYRWELH
jgi:glutamate synthase domain-containing protein 1